MAVPLESHLSRSVPGLHDSQFGFWRGRSTAHAAARVGFLVEGTEQRGYMELAVSLDVVNTFNSILWDRICRALEFYRVRGCVPVECGPGISLGPKHRLHRSWRGDD